MSLTLPLLTIVDCGKCITAFLVIKLLFRIANLKITQLLVLSGATQNRFKRLYFWIKFLSDLAKGVVAPDLLIALLLVQLVPKLHGRLMPYPPKNP